MGGAVLGLVVVGGLEGLEVQLRVGILWYLGLVLDRREVHLRVY